MFEQEISHRTEVRHTSFDKGITNDDINDEMPRAERFLRWIRPSKRSCGTLGESPSRTGHPRKNGRPGGSSSPWSHLTSAPSTSACVSMNGTTHSTMRCK